MNTHRTRISTHAGRAALGILLLILAAGCNWPFSGPAARPTTTARPVPAGLGANASPQATEEPARTAADTTASDIVVEEGGPFRGRSLRFDLPKGYRALESTDGGCFLYHETIPGFLVLYPAASEPTETLAGLLNAMADAHRAEPPLGVDIGGLTFTGLFVETGTGERLFLAAANGWALVAEGPADRWPALVAGLNRALVSLSFEEDAR